VSLDCKLALITLGFVAAIPIPNHLLTDVFHRFAMTGFVFENEMESNGETLGNHLRVLKTLSALMR
jgi:hypothetical protein